LSPSLSYSIADSTEERELHDCRMSNFNPKNQVKKQRVSDFVSIRDSQRYLSGATTFYHMRNYQVAEAGAASTTSNA